MTCKLLNEGFDLETSLPHTLLETFLTPTPYFIENISIPFVRSHRHQGGRYPLSDS